MDRTAAAATTSRAVAAALLDAAAGNRTAGMPAGRLPEM
jgi:hypothetical protein